MTHPIDDYRVGPHAKPVADALRQLDFDDPAVAADVAQLALICMLALRRGPAREYVRGAAADLSTLDFMARQRETGP